MSVRLFVGNLPYSATEVDIRQHFGTVGDPMQVVIPTDRDTGRPRGFAFVDYDDRGVAERAIQQLHGQPFKGRPLSVSEARPREARPPMGAGGFSAPRPPMGGGPRPPMGGGLRRDADGGPYRQPRGGDAGTGTSVRTSRRKGAADRTSRRTGTRKAKPAARSRSGSAAGCSASTKTRGSGTKTIPGVDETDLTVKDEPNERERGGSEGRRKSRRRVEESN